MINPRKLSCLLIVVLLAISGCASFVRAQTVQTHPFKDDFGDRAEINPAGVNVFAYDISQNEQNEPDGGWISGNSYQVNWTIRLDYVNQDMISGKSYILFYLPSPLDVEFPNANVAKQIITNQTILSPTNKSGSLSATFSPLEPHKLLFQPETSIRSLYQWRIIHSSTKNRRWPRSDVFGGNIKRRNTTGDNRAGTGVPNATIDSCFVNCCVCICHFDCGPEKA